MNRLNLIYHPTTHNATFSDTCVDSSFTGKEKDYESGCHYFGARYYDSELLMEWLSVDPMMDKYPGINPYNYCAWNPVKLVDDNGEWPWEPKHIREARKYARKNDGYLNIFRERNGVKMASVGTGIMDDSGQQIFIIRLFRPQGYNPNGEIREAGPLPSFEMWLDEPSESTGEVLSKTVISIAYETLNGPCKLLTGRTLAGSEASSMEKTLSFLNLVASPMAKGVKGATIIKNEFVKLDRIKDVQQARRGLATSIINKELMKDIDLLRKEMNNLDCYNTYINEFKKYSDNRIGSDY